MAVSLFTTGATSYGSVETMGSIARRPQSQPVSLFSPSTETAGSVAYSSSSTPSSSTSSCAAC